MQAYKFTVKYIPLRAQEHCRFIVSSPTSSATVKRRERNVKWVPQESTPVALTTREIERTSEDDPELKSVRECLLNGRWNAIEFKVYLLVRGKLSAILESLFFVGLELYSQINFAVNFTEVGA